MVCHAHALCVWVRVRRVGVVLCGTFLVATTQSFPSIFCIAVGCRMMFVRVDSFVELLSCSNRSESILQSKTCPSTSGSLVPSPALHSNLSFASVRKMRDACMYEYVMRFCGRAGAHACAWLCWDRCWGRQGGRARSKLRRFKRITCKRAVRQQTQNTSHLQNKVRHVFSLQTSPKVWWGTFSNFEI